VPISSLKAAKGMKKKETGSVGIFWAIQRPPNIPQLLTLECNLEKAELYGDMLTCSLGHYDVWSEWQVNGPPDPTLRSVIASNEYEEWPRGRIVYDTKSSRFILYADRQILCRPELLDALRAEFQLPKRRTETKPDGHYRSTRKLLV
jgi:hypothetical protein